MFTRRRFLCAAGLSVAQLGLPSIRQACAGPADAFLERIVRDYAANPSSAWLMIHGIRAMGKSFTVGDQTALDRLCSQFLAEQTVQNTAYLYMPIKDEGHPHCFLSEAVLDAGVPPDYHFQRDGRSYTVADLVLGAKALFKFDPSQSELPAVIPYADTLAWSLIVFAYSTDAGNDTWINAYGDQLQFAEVVEFAMRALERGTQHIQTVAASGGTSLPASDHVHELTCVGTHLIYGLATCLRLGHQKNALAERMKAQFDLLCWRLQNDPKLVDAHYKEIEGEYPARLIRMYSLGAKLKFLGHALEVLNYARLHKLFEPTTEQMQTIGGARQALSGVFNAISAEGVESFKADEMLFNYLVGDACHAYHATTMDP